MSDPRAMSLDEFYELSERILRARGRLSGREWVRAMLNEDPRCCDYIFTTEVGITLSREEITQITEAGTRQERLRLYKQFGTIDNRLRPNYKISTRMRRRISRLNPQHPVWGGSMNGYTFHPRLEDHVKFVQYTLSRNRNASDQFADSVSHLAGRYSANHASLISDLNAYTMHAMDKSFLDQAIEEVKTL